MAKKVLVIDDDPVVVKYLISLLEDNGYETCTAGNGKEAMNVLKAEKPDLITLDLEMPEEWGTRFYRKFKQDEELKDTPVIIISGMPSRHLSVRDAVGYLAKPFDPEEVIALVEKALA
jgi:CheY-like chemotaxis protein